MSAEENNYTQQGKKGFQPGNPGGAFPGWVKTTLPNNPVAVELRKQETIRMLLEGANLGQIAEILGIAKHTVASYLKEPEVRAQLLELNSQLLGTLDKEMLERFRSKAEIVDELAYLALAEMKNILQDKNAHIGVRAKMIDSVLDRTPELSRTKKLDVTQRTFSMKAEDLLAAANAAREIEAKARMKEAEELVASDSEQDLARE